MAKNVRCREKLDDKHRRVQMSAKLHLQSKAVWSTYQCWRWFCHPALYSFHYLLSQNLKTPALLVEEPFFCLKVIKSPISHCQNGKVTQLRISAEVQSRSPDFSACSVVCFQLGTSFGSKDRPWTSGCPPSRSNCNPGIRGMLLDFSSNIFGPWGTCGGQAFCFLSFRSFRRTYSHIYTCLYTQCLWSRNHFL